jgi:hypothetical protein
MAKISEKRFTEICEGISRDRATIVRHNPIGSEDEILLWMLLSVLITYLSLSELETPCFTGTPDAETYRKAIEFILKDRRETDFDPSRLIAHMLSEGNLTTESTENTEL